VHFLNSVQFIVTEVLREDRAQGLQSVVQQRSGCAVQSTLCVCVCVCVFVCGVCACVCACVRPLNVRFYF